MTDDLRQYALDFCDRATAGPKGVARGDAPYERVTEGRHTFSSYSACGDLGNALLYACGLRSSKYVNREENSSYIIGWNVVKLDALARSLRDYTKNPVTTADIAALQPGDITIVWNRSDTTDAHVAVVRKSVGHMSAYSDDPRPRIATSDYGQGAPLDGKECIRVVNGAKLGERKLQRVIKLDEAVARFGVASPIPLVDYFAVKGPLRRPTLRQGSTGEHVKNLQALLNAIRHEIQRPLLKVDGDFGPKTDAAVEEFQRGVGLVADGVVGPKTWFKLEA